MFMKLWGGLSIPHASQLPNLTIHPGQLAKGPIESQQPLFVLVHHVFINTHAAKVKEGKRYEDNTVPMRKGKTKVMSIENNCEILARRRLQRHKDCKQSQGNSGEAGGSQGLVQVPSINERQK